MEPTLGAEELTRLIGQVFGKRPGDRGLALLVDLPDGQVVDHPAWAARRRLVSDWRDKLRQAINDLGLERVDLVCYRNSRRNNAELPERAVLVEGKPPDHADELAGQPETSFDEIFTRCQILIAVTEMSATAPLKLHASRHGFRAATMPGFGPKMIPALGLDYEEIQRRCVELKALLDRAVAARIRCSVRDRESELFLDLRHRSATASGGQMHEPGTAGNLPSGETYIVPYEGERPGDPSRSRGELPLELDGELMLLRIESNRVREVIGDGPRARHERREIAAEPAYANIAELGLGVLADYGIRPIGELLLDEKLGLHIAFGRSDHFGGQVGAADFSAPEKVVHIDRVYLPEVQPSVLVSAVDLELEDGSCTPLMRGGAYV
jgi:hypothetical protein